MPFPCRLQKKAALLRGTAAFLPVNKVLKDKFSKPVYMAQSFFRSSRTKHSKAMRSLLYLIAVILIIGWLLGAFVWNAGGLIHILLVLAVISLIIGFIRRGSID